MKTSSFWICLVAATLLFPRENYAVGPSTAAVGMYDETTSQTNNVNFNAAGNSHSASTGDGASYSTTGTFNSLVAAAFTGQRGGVGVFDNLSNGTTSTVLIVTYAGGTKQFTLTFSGNYTISTGTIAADSAPTSGSNYLEPPSTALFTISLGSINGASVGETGFSEIGLTLLSADVQGSPGTPINFGNVSMTAHFSDNSTASVSRTISEGKGAGDTFFDILAPGGLTITSLDISGQFGAVPDIDDLAFITNAPVPEPSIWALLLFAPAMLLGRRALRAR